jgi:uncharacterized membrane protein
MIQKLFDFLLDLHEVTLRDWSKLRFGFIVEWHWLVILFFCALFFGFGYWSYRAQSASPNKRFLMGVLRGVSLTYVFLLLCRPQLVLDYTEQTSSVVAVWLDSSASMTLEDPYKSPGMTEAVKRVTGETKLEKGQTRANRYQMALDHLEHAAWLRELVKHQQVEFFTGGSSPRRIGKVASLAPGQDLAAKIAELDACVADLRKIKPDVNSTDVPSVVTGINDIVLREGHRLSSIVLMTDGQTTTGSRPDLALAELARARSGSEVFSIGVGQEELPVDLRISTPVVPPGVFVKDPVAVKVKVNWSGLERATPAKVVVSRVLDNGSLTQLAEEKVDLAAGAGEKDVELIFKPEKKSNGEKSETYNLQATIEPLAALPSEELTLANNVSRGTLKVYDAEMNVLYVEGYPRWEWRYLKNEFIRETTVNVSSLLISADIESQAEGDPEKKDAKGKVTFAPVNRFPETKEDIEQFDVILIGDVRPDYFSPTQMKLILDHVRLKGAGLGWIAGAGYNPDAYANTPLADLLPVKPDDANRPALARPDNVGFNLELTAEGKNSNLFRFFDSQEKNLEQVKNLPELYWYKPVLGAKPGAAILAVHPTRSQGSERAPLIVTARVGKGRVVYSGICDTWLWRRYTGEPLFQTYWLQMARLLFQDRAMDQTSKRVTLTSSSTSLEVDGELMLTLDVKDTSLLNTLGESVRVKLNTRSEGGGGRLVDIIKLDRVKDDQYEGKIKLRNVGDFRAELDVPTLADEGTGLDITVALPSREREKLNIDKDAMELLARKTGGSYVDLSTAESLVQKIPDRSEPVMLRRNEELWIKPLALVLAILLLSSEWLLRKSAGLI